MSRFKYEKPFADLSGNAVGGGRITVYVANSNTLATIYSSSGSSTAINGSYVTSDSTDGFFSFWVDTSDYLASTKFKIVLAKSGFTPKPIDDVAIFQGDVLLGSSQTFTAPKGFQNTVSCSSGLSVTGAISGSSGLSITGVITGSSGFTASYIYGTLGSSSAIFTRPSIDTGSVYGVVSSSSASFSYPDLFGTIGSSSGIFSRPSIDTGDLYGSFSSSSGTFVRPTLTRPAISDFTDATHTHSSSSGGGTVTIANSSVSQAKLKTSQGSVSVTATNTQTKTLPGGEYGFYPEVRKNNQDVTNTGSFYFTISGDSNAMITTPPSTDTGYQTLIRMHAEISSGTFIIYARQRYVTASGKDHWIFLLVEKGTNKIIAGYEAPDHPSANTQLIHTELQHPFVDYDPALHEIVLVDNADLLKIKPKLSRLIGILDVINNEAVIDDTKSPAYQPREIVKIDEWGDMPGEDLGTIVVPQWAKIVIQPNMVSFKRFIVDALPPEILYKRLWFKGA